jgi:hypothetical protein
MNAFVLQNIIFHYNITNYNNQPINQNGHGNCGTRHGDSGIAHAAHASHAKKQNHIFPSIPCVFSWSIPYDI